MEDFADRLLDWFKENGRKNLPWQQELTPYRVWVSEIMLQQTQVTTVIPYFNNFMTAFPNLAALANASEDLVLHQWTGLGYYARARNLLKTAKELVQQYNGELPLSVSELVALPGIGRSTAGAIVAICANKKATILDGNVKRVLARCFAIEGWPGKTRVADSLWIVAERLTPDTNVANYTQAIMDLGATLCTRTSPDCGQCPFNKDCAANLNGQIVLYPGKKPKKVLPIRETTMVLIENLDKELLLLQRPSKGLWGGLWSFPEGDVREVLEQMLPFNTGDQIEEQQTLPVFRHTFTHFHLDITPVHVKLAYMPSTMAEAGSLWFSASSPDKIGLTKPVTRLLGELNSGIRQAPPID
jgi:A/G-specific adenine glycosylase